MDWCFSYNSSANEIVRLAHSPGGNYVAAGTPNQQPTATDECFDAASNAWVSTNTVSRPWDTVWHLWGNSTKTMFRIVTTTQANIAVTGFGFCAYIAGEKITSALQSPATFSLTTGGGTVPVIKSYYQGGDGSGGRVFAQSTTFNDTYSSNNNGDIARVHAGGSDGNSKASIGGEMPGGNVGVRAGTALFWLTRKLELQGSQEILALATLGAANAGFDGMLGTKIDHWFSIGTADAQPAFLEMYGQAKLWAICPGIILPGDGVTYLTDR